MLINPTDDMLRNTYRCRKKESRYLILKGMPLFHYKNGFYYFIKTTKLAKELKNLPFKVKVQSLLKM